MQKNLLLKILFLCLGITAVTAFMVLFLSKNIESTEEDEIPTAVVSEADNTVSASSATVNKPNADATKKEAGNGQPAIMITPADDSSTDFDESTLRPVPGSDSTYTPDRAEMPGIMCWGDSLTVGYLGTHSYPSLLNQWLAQDGYKCDVVNMGATGEDSRAIAARAGGIPMLLKGECIIQGDREPSDAVFVDPNGKEIHIQLYDSVGVNPAYVTDEDGNTVEVEIYNNDIYTGYANYTVKAYEEGHLIPMKAGDEIIPYGAKIHPDYLKIIYSGNNGGFSDMQEYIAQIDSIINQSGYKEFYIVIGITVPGIVDFDEYDKVMEAAYGNHYLNFRKYLAEYDYTELGYAPSESDRNCYLHGDYSPWMMSDELHFNDTNYSILAQAVYEKIYELGYNEGFYE